MAKISNERYAIVSSEGERHLVNKMGVVDKNIYDINMGNELIKRLSAGDTLCVASINSFSAGGYDLFCKLQYLSNQGIEFQSLNERYLNFSVLKPLPPVVCEALRNFAAREYEFLRWIQSGTVSNNVKAQLVNRVQWETLADIMLVFGNNGIKRRVVK